jgi:hypothetical protein
MEVYKFGLWESSEKARRKGKWKEQRESKRGTGQVVFLFPIFTMWLKKEE